MQRIPGLVFDKPVSTSQFEKPVSRARASSWSVWCLWVSGISPGVVLPLVMLSQWKDVRFKQVYFTF